MELQMAAQGARPAGRSTPPRHAHAHAHSGGARPVPGYLRPSPGSCHHACKYGGAHAFDDKDAHHRKQQPPRPPASKSQSQSQSQSQTQTQTQNRVMVKVRSVFRRRGGESGARADKASNSKGKAEGGVEWEDIVVVAYGRVPPAREPSPAPEEKLRLSAHHHVAVDAKKKDGVKGKKKSHGKAAKITALQPPPLDTPKGKKKPTGLLVEKMGTIDQKTRQGYQTLSPSLVQSRADLLRDLQKEMLVAHQPAAANVKKQEAETPAHSLDQQEEEDYAAAAESSSRRPVPAHRRAKSMGVSISSRSVRYPLARQPSKTSGAFKLRSRSTRAPTEEERPAPARARSRRGDDASGGGIGIGRGIQLRIRSLRRRGVGGGGSGGAGAGFVVPAVALRHQKTLEKKKSQRLYNNLIEETAGKLVKTRKSRVKALVGAFESVISKIAK